jgi:hypothetical protein
MSSHDLYALEEVLISEGKDIQAIVAGNNAIKMARMEGILRSLISGFKPRIGELKELLSDVEH